MLRFLNKAALQLEAINRKKLRKSYESLFKDFIKLAEDNKQLIKENKRLLARLKDYDMMTEKAKKYLSEQDAVVKGLKADLLGDKNAI